MRYRESDDERKEREKKERIEKNVKEAMAAFSLALETMPDSYGYSYGPDGITIFTEFRHESFEDRLGTLATAIEKWCKDKRIPNIALRVVTKPNEAAKRQGGEVYGHH